MVFMHIIENIEMVTADALNGCVFHKNQILKLKVRIEVEKSDPRNLSNPQSWLKKVNSLMPKKNEFPLTPRPYPFGLISN